jgi:hypothetical protein
MRASSRMHPADDRPDVKKTSGTAEHRTPGQTLNSDMASRDDPGKGRATIPSLLSRPQSSPAGRLRGIPLGRGIA